MAWKKLISTLLIYLCTLQMAFGEMAARIPAAMDHDIAHEELTTRMESFKTQIAGKEEKPECDSEKGDALEEAITKNSSSLDDAADFASKIVDENFADASEEEKERMRQAARAGADELDKSEVAPVDPNLVQIGDNTEANWTKILSKMDKNACGEYSYSFDPDEPAEEIEECKPVKTKGHIDLIVEEIMKNEKDEVDPKPFDLNDPIVRKLHKEAKFFKEEVRKYLYDDKVDQEVRRQLLIDYLGKVVLQLRDLVVVRRAYTDREYGGLYFYNGLLPQIPTSLFPEDDPDARDLITMGPSPSTEPYHIEMRDMKFGRSQLAFKRLDVMSRDLITLMKAPTTLNYVRGLKWMTLHMMMSQMYIYNAMLKDKSPLAVPNSCQNHFNGDLPPEFKFNLVEGQGEEYINNILASQGLIFSYDNYHYTEYFLENVDKDPTKDGYSGAAPFEDYQNARIGLDEDSKMEPEFDDIGQFDTVFGMKSQEAHQVFKDTRKKYTGSRNNRKREEKAITYTGSELFKKITAVANEYQVYEIKDSETGEIKKIMPARQNLSTYLAEVMQRKGATHYTHIISNKLETKLRANQSKVDLPALYGSSIWRNWGLSTLSQFAEENKEKKLSTKLDRALKSACYSGGRTSLCKKDGNKALTGQRVLSNLAEELKEFRGHTSYTPARRILEDRYKPIYKTLGTLWNAVRDNSATDSFIEAKPSEWEYLQAQMGAENPWARLRLGYLVAMDELEAQRSGHTPVYKRHSRRGRLQSENTRCFYKNIDTKITKLKEAGKLLGLNLTLRPAHGNRILSDEEKQYIWKDTIDSADEGTSKLFSTKDSSGKPYYKHLEDISYKTILSKEKVDELKIPGGISAEARQTIDEVLASDEGKKNTFFLELYKYRGDVEKQKKMYEDFAKENGIDSEYMVKVGFLAIENNLKKPIYHSIMQDAAGTRKRALTEQLEKFCNLEPEDHESMQALFYSTAKQQNKLNQLAGIKGTEVVEKVLDKVNEMSPEEWMDMWWGIGAGVLAIGAMIIGAACTGATGGLCAPLGVAMIGFGLGALGAQTNLVRREYNRKVRADDFEKSVELMEDLGFANEGDSYNVSRSWGWTIFESICVIPLFNIVSKSVTVGTRIAATSAKTMLRQSGKVGINSAYRASGKSAGVILREADDDIARVVLGLDSTAARAGGAIMRGVRGAGNLGAKAISFDTYKAAFAKVAKLRHLFSLGRISMKSMLDQIASVVKGLKVLLKGTGEEGIVQVGRAVVKETPQMIDKQTAKAVSKYWGGNPQGLSKLLGSYTKKWSPTSLFKGRWGRMFGTNRLAYARLVMQNVENGKYLWGTNWIRKLRFEQLAKHGSKILRIQDELAMLAKNGEVVTGAAKQTVKTLEDYIIHNADDLTEVFMKIPMRKRELLYVFLLQGGGHKAGFFGRRLPMIGDMADGILMRKFFNARDRLLVRSLETSAREMLGLSQYYAAESTFEIFRAFRESVDAAADALPEKEGRRLLSRRFKVEEEIADRLIKAIEDDVGRDTFLSKVNKATFGRGSSAKKISFKDLSITEVRKVLFNPTTVEEQAIGRVIWKSLDLEDLFGFKELPELASQAVKDLSNYQSVDGFQRFINAMRVLTIQKFKDVGVVEIM